MEINNETNTTKPTEADSSEKPLSIVEEARAIRDEIVKERAKLDEANALAQKIQADNLLGSSAGGHIDAPQVSPEDAKKAGAKEFFKGTQLERDIEAS